MSFRPSVCRVALLADINLTSLTVEPMTYQNARATHGANRHDFRSIWVVEEVEGHHAGVFRSPELIKLIVVDLTKVQKS